MGGLELEVANSCVKVNVAILLTVYLLELAMCRNIKTLYNFDPPATEAEISAAALQYVRKLSGYNQPSAVNQQAFDQAVAQIADVSQSLLDALSTKAPARNREQEAQKARARSKARFG